MNHVRLLRIQSLDAGRMLARAQVVGDGGGGCWLDRGLLLALPRVEEGMPVHVVFNALDEPIGVREARTE